MKINNTNQNLLNKSFLATIGTILAGIYGIQKLRSAAADANLKRDEYSRNVSGSLKKINKRVRKYNDAVNRLASESAGPNTLSAFPSFDVSTVPNQPPMPQKNFFGFAPIDQTHDAHLIELGNLANKLKSDTKSIDSIIATKTPQFYLSMNSKEKNEMSKTEFFEEQMKKNLGLNSQEIKNRLSKAQFAGNNLAKIEDKYSWSPGILQQEDIMNPGTVQFPESLPKPQDERLNSSSINKDLINEDFVEHMSRSLGVSREHIISKLSLADFKQNPFLAKSGPDWKREKLTAAEVKKKNNIENPPLISDESPF